MKSIEFYWYESSLLLWLLLPLSWLYCLTSAIRRKLYQFNIKKSYAAQVPVVVVGNIVVGGSGKTPLLISLCEFVKDKGYKPGVVSRGYGGKLSGIKQLSDNDSAELVGDEPLMIYQRSNVPVVVGADRVSAVNHLLENNACDIVFSDDGLQHYRMKRDLEIAVIDAARKFGNGFCLPAGPLRETVSRLKEVDIVVYNGHHLHEKNEYFYSLKIVAINRLNANESKVLSSFAGKSVHAVAGIGNPSRFFDQLRESGLDVIEHSFPDHHAYVQHDFSEWRSECIIMTEKDAVKCRDIALPDAWVVAVKADFSPALESKIASCLLPLLN